MYNKILVLTGFITMMLGLYINNINVIVFGGFYALIFVLIKIDTSINLK